MLPDDNIRNSCSINGSILHLLKCFVHKKWFPVQMRDLLESYYCGLTYKAYVEDEEDEKRNAKATIAYASDDEMSDSEEPSSFVQNDKIPCDDLSQRVVYDCAHVTGTFKDWREFSKSQQEDSGNGGISGLEVKNANSDRSSADDGAQVSSIRDMVLCGSLATSFAEEFHIGSRDNDAQFSFVHFSDTTPVIYSAMDVLFWRSKSLNKVDLGSLPDTVPKDRVVVLRGGWSLFGKGSAGELLLRAYIQSIRGG
ncbi:hypothetical protein F2Q70_00036938 [Brassica cretica]|uniref:Uncharacterized protein n=1 Tax=Brassica cretica TaxID=69181 RepID=A0A8S9JS30_BRACR|nr:hypothetical protein F2Q70_00036938 [Brassica cretica]